MKTMIQLTLTTLIALSASNAFAAAYACGDVYQQGTKYCVEIVGTLPETEGSDEVCQYSKSNAIKSCQKIVKKMNQDFERNR